MSELERDVAHRICVAWGAHPRIRFWRMNTGVGWFANGQPARKTDPGAYPVRFGIEGGSDYIGLIYPEGRFFALETKRKGGKQRDSQKRFQAMIERMGGAYVLAMTLEEFDATMAALGITR